MSDDIKIAFERIKDQQDIFVKNIKQTIIEKYDVLWELAMEKQDIKTATTILKQESELFGLNEPVKQEVSIKEADFEISFS